jgi:multidrug efflux pump subunit AcrA (membrane-fusion protein)
MCAFRIGIAVLTAALVWTVPAPAQDGKEPAPPDLARFKVGFQNLQVKVIERGALDAKESYEIRCEVKSGSRGAPRIKWVVDNGALVKKGDLIVEIDDSYLQEQALNLKKQSESAEQKALYADILEQIKKCKIHAPRSGVVIYYVPEQSRGPRGSSQSVVAKGEPVQFGQKMLSMPDLSHMVVNVHVPEAYIAHVNPALPCQIRVDALPGKVLMGKVRDVASVASIPHPLTPEVKAYRTIVEITDPVEGLKLKPGLSAAVTIETESKATHVLAVPVQAIVVPKEKEKKPRCLVAVKDGREEREVELGVTDGKLVEVKSGLKEGDEVVYERRPLPGNAPNK